MALDLVLISWNIGGARWLELADNHSGDSIYASREELKRELNVELNELIRKYNPDVVTLQEVVDYSFDGKQQNRDSLINAPPHYKYLSAMIVDSIQHPHLDKWRNVREKGRWPNAAAFCQGNAFLVREDLHVVPVTSLSRVGVTFKDWLEFFLPGADEKIYNQSLLSNVYLESGLYFGDRDTEPRSCSVLHLVLPNVIQSTSRIKRPLDVFVLNIHLTKLVAESLGPEESKRKAAKQGTLVRSKQFERILSDIVLRREKWQKDGFPVRGRVTVPNQFETCDRYAPLWIALGDFNFAPTSKEYKQITDKYFIDINPEENIPTKMSKIDSCFTEIVDYVFLRPSFQSGKDLGLGYRVAGQAFPCTNANMVSDHYPILARIKIEIKE